MVRYHPIDRPADDFRQHVPIDVVAALCRRAFGSAVDVVAVTELPWGSYNNAYRIDLATESPVVLRVAPAPERQFRVETAMMRNEYATTPYLAPLGDLLPRTLFRRFHPAADRPRLCVPDIAGWRTGARGHGAVSATTVDEPVPPDRRGYAAHS